METTNYVSHWQKSVPLLWNVDEVAASLERKFGGVRRTEFVGGSGGLVAAWGSPKRILDCGCGSGEFTIALAKRGYAIDCSDGDALMADATRQASEAAGLALDPKVLRWCELSRHFEGGYDVVMLRGNSLPYVLSWGNQEDQFRIDCEKADESLVRSFRAIREQLRRGGIFYFDMPHVFEKEGKEQVGKGEIGGIPATLTFDIGHKRGHIRRVISELTVGNAKEERIYNGLHLPFVNLDHLLQEAGFRLRDIRHCVAINGENIYSPFFVSR